MFESTCQKSSFLTLPDLDAIAHRCAVADVAAAIERMRIG